MKVQSHRILLSDIIKQRRKDLQKELELKPLNILRDEVESSNKSYLNSNDVSSVGKITNSLRQSLVHNEDVAVICEFKPASPSMGDISNSSLEDAMVVFEESGATAVSILTEEKYFKGSLDNIRSAYNITKLPIIRKDFIINAYQIYQAKMAGASAVLLMSGIYPDMVNGISLCRELELDPLVECKNREEILSALDAGADILGINNRNFQNFKVDLKTTEKLARYVPQEALLISESGVKSPEDAIQLSKYGVDALLIGTSIMGAEGKLGMLNAATSIIEAVKGSRIVRNEG
jgi:indole-3-glycerol phosphate synthase